MYWGDLSRYRSQLYGISMIWIVIFHAYEAFYDQLNFRWLSSVIFNNGSIGVDIFLFLSGISMRYSMGRYERLGFFNLMDFYKRRFGKLLKIYLIFCVPFTVWRVWAKEMEEDRFMKQILFTDEGVSTFWFLGGVAICYLIYPLLEYLLRKRKEGVIIAILAVYTVVLFRIRYQDVETYMFYEILLTRIPIFVIGALWGQKVKNNEKISRKTFSLFLFMILIKSPIIFAFSRIKAISDAGIVVERLLMGWMGIGVILLMIALIKVYEGSGVDKLLCKIGGVTLEIYVFHVALRRVMLWEFMKTGLNMEAYRYLIPFCLIFIPLSLAGGYALALVMDRIRIRRIRS